VIEKKPAEQHDVCSAVSFFLANATFFTCRQVQRVLRVLRVPGPARVPGLARVQEPGQSQPWEPVWALQPFCILQLQKIMPRRKTVKK
jgi:hypothetical protein